MKTAQASVGERWHLVEFRFKSPESLEPHLDLMVAHLVVAPIVESRQIAMWRVHRRWQADEDGHKFSFLFRVAPAVGGLIFDEIGRHAVIGRLQRMGRLGQPTNTEGEPELSWRADGGWPEAIQSAWPHYINGVCKMWLSLIQSALDGCPPATEDDDLLGQFEAANEIVSRLWHENGWHSMLHHLNAIFGGVTVLTPTKF